jgi:hypothetical protein
MNRDWSRVATDDCGEVDTVPVVCGREPQWSSAGESAWSVDWAAASWLVLVWHDFSEPNTRSGEAFDLAVVDTAPIRCWTGCYAVRARCGYAGELRTSAPTEDVVLRLTHQSVASTGRDELHR